MPIPEFDERGDLPVGVHHATLEEVIERFGGVSAQRQEVTKRLSRVFNTAKLTGYLKRFIIYGSYVTAKSDPNDVDIFLVMSEGFDINNYTGEIHHLFSHNRAQEHFGASVFWVTQGTSLASIDDLIFGWQTKRDLSLRGIVEIEL